MAIDGRDFAGLAACFTPDGIWAGPKGERKGRAEIADYVEMAVGHLTATQHIATNFRVETDGSSAAMHSSFIATHILHGDIYQIGGRYEDRIMRDGGIWLFARRDIVPLWASGNPGVMDRP